MTDPSKNLPPHLQALLDAHQKSIEQPPRRDRDREWAERLDRCRQFDQSRMPPWKDPRGG
jgi:hypothetical protein